MMALRCWTLCLLLQLLVINKADSSHNNNTIRIGYLVSYLEDGGAINVAIDQAQKDGLMSDYNFR